MQFHESVLDEGQGYEREKVDLSQPGGKGGKFKYKTSKKTINYTGEEETSKPKFYKGRFDKNRLQSHICLGQGLQPGQSVGSYGEVVDKTGKPILGRYGELVAVDGSPILGPKGELIGFDRKPICGMMGELLGPASNVSK